MQLNDFHLEQPKTLPEDIFGLQIPVIMDEE